MKLLFRLRFSFYFFFLFLTGLKLWAAACCGGSSGTSSLIMGDQKALLNATYSWTSVIIDSVDSHGYWHSSSEHQTVQNLRLEAAHIFWDQWQTSVAIPLVSRSKFSDTYSGLGDAVTTVGYEYLPEWNYNPYRPHGVAFLSLTLPTGKSKYDSVVGGLDSRGQGVWAIGIGTLLNKTWTNWDVITSLEVHKSFSQKISQDQELHPGFGGQFTVSAGYNLSTYRIGSNIIWNYEDPVTIENSFSSIDGSPERYATYAANFSYFVGSDWSGTIIYTDQTLFGSPLNTSLGRGFSLQFQRKWNR